MRLRVTQTREMNLNNQEIAQTNFDEFRRPLLQKGEYPRGRVGVSENWVFVARDFELSVYRYPISG